MTDLQKQIIELLFNGHCIAVYRNDHYRVRDEKHSPVRSFYKATFDVLSPFLRQSKNGFLVIDKNAIRQQRNNTWIKQFYKSQTKIK